MGRKSSDFGSAQPSDGASKKYHKGADWAEPKSEARNSFAPSFGQTNVYQAYLVDNVGWTE